MKRFVLFFLFIFFVFSVTAQAVWQPDTTSEYRRLRYLSKEEMLLPVRTQVNFTETPPPSGTVRMVAEYEPMQAVLIRYPFGITYPLIKEMANNIQVITIVSSSSQANTVLGLFQSNGVNTANCTFLIAPTESFWTRDYGPLFIFDGNNQPGVCDFPYNRPRPNDNNIPIKVAQHLGINLFGMNVIHTGGNIMSDGMSIGASTDLVTEENPTQTAAQIKLKTQNYLGFARYDITLDPLADYIKHIDCWAKYLAPDKILIGRVLPSDARYANFEAVANYFATALCAYGYPYKVYRVFTPGGSPSTPYTNSLILNNKVFVPITGSQHDNAALEVYRQAMPGYQIIGSHSTAWLNTDALHCRTHEVADLGMLYVDHRPKFGILQWQDSVQITAKIIPHSGQTLISDSLRIFYQINRQGYTSVALRSALGNNFTGYIKNYNSFDTIRYYIAAADASGRKIKHPYMGSFDPHQFILPQKIYTQNTELASSSIRVYPNPFSNEVSFTVDVSHQHIELQIYDVQGKLVYSQLSSNATSTSNQLIWNGNQLDGRRVQKGIYYYQLQVGNVRHAGKIIRM